VATSVGGGGGGGGETAGAWSSHASTAAAAVQDTTARVVRTGAGRLCMAPAPAAASSHQSDAPLQTAAKADGLMLQLAGGGGRTGTAAQHFVGTDAAARRWRGADGSRPRST